MVRAVLAAILCAACQGQPAGPGTAGSASGGASPSGDASAGSDAGSGEAVASGSADARGRSDELEASEPGRVINELGAIPAWQAVVDRAQLLGRRGQHGVVYGRVGPVVMVPAPPPPSSAGVIGATGSGSAAGTGAAVVAGSSPVAAGGSGVRSAAGPAIAAATGSGARPGAGSGAVIDAGMVKSPYVWLIDDTEGNGTLGIRIALGDKAREGDRIAAGGAWQLDAERRWFWKPDAIQPLPPATASDLKEPQPAAPSHVITNGDLLPGARTASVARDSDAVYFQIVGPAPVSEGDGWQVADQLGSPTALVMNLPGERASYGGQDMRSPDERWQLRRAQTYWVRIGKLHKRGDKPPTVNARTAPIRVL
jgi:hypothetical protein